MKESDIAKQVLTNMFSVEKDDDPREVLDPLHDVSLQAGNGRPDYILDDDFPLAFMFLDDELMTTDLCFTASRKILRRQYPKDVKTPGRWSVAERRITPKRFQELWDDCISKGFTLLDKFGGEVSD